MTELFRERYEPLEVVGEGGQGRVVRAWDHLHERTVALKIRCPGPDRSGVLSEARVLLDLTPHRLLPLVRDDFFSGDEYCLVMDWVEGETLAQRLARADGPGLSLEDVIGPLAQVAEALDHLHAHEPPVIHGDVKPANVVLTPEGRAVLVDFGIAGSGGRGRAYASRGYAAPEVATGAAPTPAADVFSLAATAFALLTGAPPGPGARPRWRALGRHQAAQVEMALHRGLAYDPHRRPRRASELVSALAGEATAASNLPVATTSFIGREAELVAICRRLRSARLLTLVGPGGVGKTRLATSVGAQGLSDAEYADGVYLVDLAAVAEPALVAAAVATTLGLVSQPGEQLEDTLADHLVARRLLLVLDNCEHVIDGAAQLVAHLLSAAPNLRTLATSREPLAVAGEEVWQVQPLTLPPAADASPESIAGAEAVRMFVARAAVARGGFTLDATTAAAVSQICRRLDGMPLAIELAAARSRGLSVRDLAARLDDRFRLLSAGPRSSHPRHRTLRAVVDWSYNALPEPEHDLFPMLSVFAGPFSLAAAEALAAGGGIDGHDVVDVLSALVDRSLVVCGDDGRYRLLETLRAYGAERLAAAEKTDILRNLHLEWFAGLAASCQPPYGPDAGEVLDGLEADHDNLRAALRWALDHGRAEVAGELACSLETFWYVRGHYREARRWFDQIVGAAVEGRTGATARRSLARFTILQNEDFAEATRLLDQSLTWSRQAGDCEGIFCCLETLMLAAHAVCDRRAGRHWLEEALAEHRRTRPGEELPARLYEMQAWMARIELDSVAARELHRRALCRARADGDEVRIIENLVGLGQVSEGVTGTDDVGQAKAAYEEALWRGRRAGFARALSIAPGGLGRIVLASGDAPGAATLVAVALRETERIGNRQGSWVWLLAGAAVAAVGGSMEVAARILGLASALGRTGIALPFPIFERQEERTVLACRAALPEHAFRAAFRTGEDTPVVEGVPEVIRWLEAFGAGG